MKEKCIIATIVYNYTKDPLNTLKQIKKLSLFTLLISLLTHSTFGQGNSQGDKKKEVLHIETDLSIKYQTIHHFGASDAWSCQFVGNWPAGKKEKIAELLFSKKFDENGSPKGIGLSMWRFNLGAGSAEQGDASDIKDEWRRAESFLNADGSYNWNKQKGQIWFAEKAKDEEVENLLVFSNSPPVALTKNGKAYANKGENNLARENYAAFAQYLAKSLKNLEQKGLKPGFISPVNEPQWDWSNAGQEGTPFSNSEIAEIVRELDKALEKEKLSTTLDVAEAGKINYLIEDADKPARGNQINEFFSKDSENYLGNLKHVENNISGHSYFTTSPFDEAQSLRRSLANRINEVPGLSFWMSEYCILGGNNGDINGNKRDLSMPPALYVARTIHNDLTFANAAAWNWWIAISPYNYKDGLIYIDKNKTDGQFYPSKILWTLGNYSRFIRPGFKRVEVTIQNKLPQNKDFLVSAFYSKDSNQLVYVVVNSQNFAQEISLVQNELGFNSLKAYLTSEESDLQLLHINTNDKSFTIPENSVVTIIAEK
ncbi:MAG: xylanase [Cytophagales bacterium]|nr:xylanase [Cytophagales bacterium]